MTQAREQKNKNSKVYVYPGTQEGKVPSKTKSIETQLGKTETQQKQVEKKQTASSAKRRRSSGQPGFRMQLFGPSPRGALPPALDNSGAHMYRYHRLPTPRDTIKGTEKKKKKKSR